MDEASVRPRLIRAGSGLVLALLIAVPASADTLVGRVVKVMDGDTTC